MSKKTKTPRKAAPKFTPEELDANTLLLVRGGSRLYGLAHENSDEDFYRVVPDEHFWKAMGKWPSGNPRIKATQTIIGTEDQMLVSEKSFHIFCFEGAPQALESMFANDALIDRIGPFRNAYFAGLNLDHMCGRYLRTIKSFAYGNFKKRRHSLRMSINLREAMETGGRFNPTLTEDQAAYATATASSSAEEFITALSDINYFTIDEDWNMEEIRANFAQGN